MPPTPSARLSRPVARPLSGRICILPSVPVVASCRCDSSHSACGSTSASATAAVIHSPRASNTARVAGTLSAARPSVAAHSAKLYFDSMPSPSMSPSSA